MKDVIRKLVELQKGYDKINEGDKVIKRNKDISVLNKIKKEFQELRLRYIEKKNELEKAKNRSIELSNEIEVQKEELLKLEDKLYKECGSDLKLISKCEKEILNYKEAINNKENEYFSLMEQEDILSKEKDELKIELVNLKSHFDDYKSEASNRLAESRAKIKEGKQIVESLEKEIPDGALNIYNSLKRQKNNPIVPVENNVCMGCKIKLPMMTTTKLNEGQEIIYCDNCGRMIYLPEK
ncbi:C4-type zinc ribbon domain-containing protein [Clostridium sp. MB40-C1]|uniref:zinc ribbon domain-containing protein n=1 Tax=Clostridium sp. MB40-C1 TaxID=3070996 RepID=UPI0027E0F737|nr:C4-type zinc ribbon domain-containing protein [Clostridium sp. MB40-C1]WMJ82293.1 C4-type zinc ribbon domain-containing protein [Clostridium sp. MB40-C1]